MQRVIIVDDDRQVGLCLQKLIPWETLDMTVVGVALSGEEGFSMAVELSPDIIISDLVMPGLDGAGLCERVTNLMSGVSFIFLTAYEDFDAMRLALRCHAADYVLKPIDRSKIDYMTQLLSSLKKSGDERAFLSSLVWDKAVEADMLCALLGKENAYFAALFRRLAADSVLLSREPNLVRMICLHLTELFFRAQADSPAQRQRCDEVMAAIRQTRFTMDMLLVVIDLYSALTNAPGAEEGYYRELCTQVRTYIDAHYADPALSLAAVAAAFSYSPDHLGRIFARTAGKTVLTCITDQRLKEAMHLLQETALPVRSVAEAVGYDNPGHLTRLLKKRTGLTPQEYREKSHAERV